MRKLRRSLLAAAAAVSSAVVWTGVAAPAPLPSVSDPIVQAACALPHEQLVRVWRGTMPGRTGDLLIVPRDPNFVGFSYPHSGPSDYLQRVPMFWYGPGYIRPVGSIDRPVTMADVAPTQAELLGYPFHAPDGRPMTEALVPAARRPDPPRLIVTVVWDAGGRDVIDTWPGRWPYVEGLIPEGAWYENATLGSSPSITPATHATLGTGAFPMRTGQVDAEFRIGNALVRSGQFGPELLVEPTLADLYDRAMGNEPKVGLVATVTWHLNMMGHGTMWGGGDRDIAVLRTVSGNEGAEGNVWNIQARNAPYFSLPPYVNDLPPLSSYFHVADAADGVIDGTWRGHDIAEERGGFDTPARLPYQTRLIEEIIAREGFGKDDVPDLFFTNYKLIDEVGHGYSINSPEMADTVRAQDADTGELIRFLNREVGKGRWVLLITADHGHQFDPAVSGAFPISPRQLGDRLTEAFDDDDGVAAIELVRNTQIFVNTAEVARNGHTLDDVARFILNYTKAQAATPDQTVPEGERDDTVFAAAFPSSILSTLPCLPEARAS